MKAQWIERISSLLGREAQAEEKRALERAFARFKKAHPDWAASLFDWYFVSNHAADALANFSQEPTEVTTARLVEAWVNQLRGFHGTSKRRVAKRAEPAARHFLALLWAELPTSALAPRFRRAERSLLQRPNGRARSFRVRTVDRS